MKNRLNFATSDEDAQSRYDMFKNTDPFTNIESALLNTADIADYVCKTGMIYPFNSDRLKPASYEMDIGGEVLCWDEQDKEEHYEPLLGKDIKLRKNSITFVTVNAKFRLPDYIAMRFNLQIEHVHKGILLGTGPLINPGFTGRLMIPLHNLTSNDYILKCGSPLIGVEFTKLSYNDSWGSPGAQEARHGVYEKNTKNKSDKTFHDYIRMFIPRGLIVKSSLSGTLDKANRSAKKAEVTIKRITRYGIIGISTLIVGLFALTYQIIGIISDANTNVASANQKIVEVIAENENIREELRSMASELKKLSKQMPAKVITQNSDNENKKNSVESVNKGE